jgi:ribonuclease HI
MSGFYAVANGRNIGIFLSWDECCNSVKGYRCAIYKKFKTKEEAEEFLENNINIVIENREPLPPVVNNIIEKPDYFVYTDGACSNNGRENAKAGIGIFFAIDDPRNVSRLLEGKQTNNSAELTAIIELYFIIKQDIISGKKIAIVTDSEYAIKCVGKYGEKCSLVDYLENNKKGEKPIPNRELVCKIYEMYKNTGVDFIHIKAHTKNDDVHSIGNYYADKLANDSLL